MKSSKSSCVQIKSNGFRNTLNKRFAVTYQYVDGEILEQDGIVSFYSEENKLLIPLTFKVKPEVIGKTNTAMIRDYDDALLLKAGDEVSWDDIDDYNDYIIETQEDLDKLVTIMEKEKENKVTNLLSLMGMTVGTVLFTLIMKFILDNTLFMVLGILMFLVLLTLVVANFISINKFKLYDCDGNWIDLQTGESSLNNGKLCFKGQSHSYSDIDDDFIENEVSI